jgi:hypothetical protein
MVAIVTDSLRKNLAGYFLDKVNDATDSNEYYIGIGKADQYNATDTIVTPTRTLREEREARNNLQSVKKITAASFVIPRYNWTSGTIYSGYTDSTVGIPTNSYYILTEDNDVYICLQQGKNASGSTNTSTVKPSYTDAGVNITEAFETADGYRWKYLYSVSVTLANNYLSSNWMPVTYQIDSSGALTGAERDQALVQEAAIPGQILGAILTSGGSGYTSAPTVTINGNGINAAATATVSGGAVVKIEMNNESAALGSGYDYASIEFSGGGGTGAGARPIIAPLSGLGSNARDDLKATSAMLNIKPDGTEGGDFIVDQDFRQIVVMKNPLIWDSDERFTATSGRALRYMTMASGTASFAADKLIRGASSNTAAYVDEVDAGNSIIYFHQNENTGFGSFTDGELIEESDGSGVGTSDSADLHSIVDPHSGEILYIENRAAVDRNSAQQEDIKVIITV